MPQTHLIAHDNSEASFPTLSRASRPSKLTDDFINLRIKSCFHTQSSSARFHLQGSEEGMEGTVEGEGSRDEGEAASFLRFKESEQVGKRNLTRKAGLPFV